MMIFKLKTIIVVLFFSFFILGNSDAQSSNNVIISTSHGQIQGFIDQETGTTNFWGIPYAQPPIGDLRWRAPQPVKDWEGILHANHFGPKAMQAPIYGDMRFRADRTSEDCLYLNIWSPSKPSTTLLPVLVYFYGGGFMAGDGSEWRYDGAALAQTGIIVVTVNYRLGIFGFFAYPELTEESPHHASGNYGLLDQNAALKWVHKNIAAFGGNPNHITIGGESAGSISVFAQMASPLSKNLISGAIGESGAMINPTFPPIPLSKAEKQGEKIAQKLDAGSLKELRAIPAKELLEEVSKIRTYHASAVIDGYFLPQSPKAIFKEGKQAQVPLLVGWNSAESSYHGLLGNKAPTPANYKTVIQQRFKDKADSILQYYPGNTTAEVIRSATHLASDLFIVYSTWKWAELQRENGEHQVYRYLFDHPRPGSSQAASLFQGAGHSWEIEYALGNLSTNKDFQWTPTDYKVSATMFGYFSNFIKTGNPNGIGLPLWIGNTKKKPVNVLRIGINSRLMREPAQRRKQHQFLDRWFQQ